MALKVIGTGFGRTGTDSMREALTILGFGPCHHMHEVIAVPEQKRLWRAFVSGTPIGWEELLAGYASCVDFPTACYWRELLAAYPDAKAVLTWRPAEDWWRSFAGTVGASLRDSTDAESVGVRLIANQLLGGRVLDRDHVVGIYEAHVAAVRATVPAERLLVHRLGDGWAPLCAHLGVPVPEVDYPRRNATADFIARSRGERPAADGGHPGD